MEYLSYENRDEITRLIYEELIERVQRLWIHSTDREKCLNFLKDALTSENVMYLEKKGTIVGVLLAETEQVPLSNSFTLPIYQKHFGILGGLRRWIEFRLYQSIQIKITPETFHIEALVVSPNYRRQGIGSQLLENAAELAGKIGKTELAVELKTTQESAHKFYEANGFDTLEYQHIRTPFIKNLAIRAGVPGFFSLERDLLANDPVTRENSDLSPVK